MEKYMNSCFLKFLNDQKFYKLSEGTVYVSNFDPQVLTLGGQKIEITIKTI